MRAMFALTIAMAAAVGLAADAHIGFDVAADTEGRIFVSRVYPTSASAAGIKPGFTIIKIAGYTVKSNEDIATRLASKSAGDVVQVRLRTDKGVESFAIRLADAKHVEKMRAEAEAPKEDAPKKDPRRMNHEEFLAKRRQEAADAEKKKEELMAKILEKHGAIIVGAGEIRMNAINRPEVSITLCNASAMEMDAVEIRVELFDKFDNPANGILGEGNEKKFLHQTPIPPKSFRDIVAPVPMNETAGKAKVSVIRYLPKNGTPVDVEKPFVLEVRQ